MLITFKSIAAAPVQMFGNVALKLLELMGRLPKAPGALFAEDVAEALALLQQGLAEQEALEQAEQPEDSADKDLEKPNAIPLKHRAVPLIALMQAAIREKKGVSWE
ncbi:MAG: DUF1840 domain-containing protein [Gammaproteobacteria bacterium]|nr:DUF1840 domain-containing protein [Gammaproteobacteria bacterium]MBU2056167.1 DUF1840 domain-containing protein [Gammaproteobacteria bacterium]MBU2173911.1 DUF1840 domain-containing protein [Gammaproteobacteria bacterium]MBU2248701.1 DUF1840 domain-containing protein [Gammaproteobacteria bacterium]MBU2344779.1 DUF1840 domain-containing protein [Gammaproteobacteria bacterium]